MNSLLLVILIAGCGPVWAFAVWQCLKDWDGWEDTWQRDPRWAARRGKRRRR